MRTASKFLLLALLAALPSRAAIADDAPAKKPEVKPITVPFELMRSRHMAVEVKINGKGPYRLIFDTGEPTNLINNKLAKEAGVTKKGDKGPACPSSACGIKTMDTVEIGGVKLDKVPVVVMDHPTVTAISNAQGPSRASSASHSSRYKTVVDYEKRELTFTPNGYVPGDDEGNDGQADGRKG